MLSLGCLLNCVSGREGEQGWRTSALPCFPGPLFSPPDQVAFFWAGSGGSPLAGLSWRWNAGDPGLDCFKKQWPHADNQEVVAVSLGALLPNRNSLEGRCPEGARGATTLVRARRANAQVASCLAALLIWPPRGQELPWSLPLLSGDERRAVCPPHPLPLLQAVTEHRGEPPANTAPRTQVVLLEDAGERGCRSHALHMGSSPRENVSCPADMLVEEGDICQLNLQPTS